MESEKQKFVMLYETGRFTKSDLCAQFGISRPTGDAILKRYQKEGWDALKERSRRPGHHPLTTPKEIEDAIVKKRKKHTHWGARKIIELLSRDPKVQVDLIPSETTVNNIMKRHGLTMLRRKVSTPTRFYRFSPTRFCRFPISFNRSQRPRRVVFPSCGKSHPSG